MNEMDVTLGKYDNSLNFIFGLTELPKKLDASDFREDAATDKRIGD